MKSLPLMGRGRRVVAVNKSKTKAAKKPRKRPGQGSEVLEDRGQLERRNAKAYFKEASRRRMAE